MAQKRKTFTPGEAVDFIRDSEPTLFEHLWQPGVYVRALDAEIGRGYHEVRSTTGETAGDRVIVPARRIRHPRGEASRPDRVPKQRPPSAFATADRHVDESPDDPEELVQVEDAGKRQVRIMTAGEAHKKYKAQARREKRQYKARGNRHVRRTTRHKRPSEDE